jgi:predicted AAA+ superfamily ATPase
LEKLALIKIVQPFNQQTLKRITKTLKIYFMDTGLAAYLLKWGSPQSLANGAMRGQFFETWVFSEIYKSYINQGVRPNLYFYHDKSGREIDLLILKDSKIYLAEIKASSTPTTSDVKHFRYFLDRYEGLYEVESGALISMYPENLRMVDRVFTYPAYWI